MEVLNNLLKISECLQDKIEKPHFLSDIYIYIYIHMIIIIIIIIIIMMMMIMVTYIDKKDTRHANK